MNCLITTRKIQDLYDSVKDRVDMPIGVFKAYVAHWQDTGGKDMDDLPSAREIESHISGAIREEHSDDMVEWVKPAGEVKGENIAPVSRGGSEFSSKLANQGNSLIVTLDGVTYKNAEHAYQSLKSGRFDREYYESERARKSPYAEKNRMVQTDTQGNDALMTRILTAKLMQHPELIDGIRERGGIRYIDASWHRITDNANDRWESGGFTRALRNAYRNAIMARKEGTRQTRRPIQRKAVDAQMPWTREEAENDTRTLYIFGDNGDRDSGGNEVDSQSAYAGKHAQDGRTLHYPSSTSATVRGLPNAMPVTMQRHYDRERNGDRMWSLWNDENFQEFKKVVDADFLAILDEWNTGKYDRIMFPPGGLLGGEAMMSRMSVEDAYRSKCASYLQRLEQRLRDIVDKDMGQDTGDPFSGRQASRVEAGRKVDMLFDPLTRARREALLADLFSRWLDTREENMARSLDARAKAINEEIDSARKGGMKQERINRLRMRLADVMRMRKTASRLGIIRTVTPAFIFNELYKDMRDFVYGKSKEQQTQIIFGDFAEAYGELSDEDRKWLMEEARKYADGREAGFKVLVDNPDVFRTICEGAARRLIVMEGIVINTDGGSAERAYLFDDANGERTEFDSDNPIANEETTKEGWMTQVNQISSFESVTQAVRRMLSRIVRSDEDGYGDFDDMGYETTVDAGYAHATLIDALKDMDTPEDMDRALAKLARRKPWVRQVIDKIGTAGKPADAALYSQMFRSYRMDYVEYWIQKHIMTDGLLTRTKTVNLSMPEGIGWLMDRWRDSIQSGEVLNKKDSVYDNAGRTGKREMENGDRLVSRIEELRKRLMKAAGKHYGPDVSAEEEDRVAAIKEITAEAAKEENIREISGILRALGIDVNTKLLIDAISGYTIYEGYKPDVKNIPVLALLNNAMTIVYAVSKGRVKDMARGDGSMTNGSVFTEFKGAYSSIARMLSDVNEDVVESYVREAGKGYYSHVLPNYVNRLVRNLKNASKDRAKMRSFIETEFKRYEWFYKNGKWLNTWIEELAGLEGYSEEELAGMRDSDKRHIDERAQAAREALRKKTVLNAGKVEYGKLGGVEYAVALIAEFFSEPENRGKDSFAWYPLAVMSNVQSMEFLRAKMYKDNFKERILAEAMKTVIQEYNRIQVVRARANIRNGRVDGVDRNRVAPIQNLDINGDRKGGAEFKFYPALNSLMVEYDGRQMLFLDAMDAVMSEKGNIDETEKLIKDALRQVYEDGFAEAMGKWFDMGLFTEMSSLDKRGKMSNRYKYLDFLSKTGFKDGYRHHVEQIDMLLEKFADRQEMVSALKTLRSHLAERTRTAPRVIRQEIDSLLIRLELDHDVLSEEEYETAIDTLRKDRDYVAESLEMYYWNSAFAMSQSMELTVTDLAFSENLEYFYKRYKEIHSTGSHLNTSSRYGREIEKSVYIADEEIVSSSLKDLERGVEEKRGRGEISDLDAAMLLAAYGSTYWDGHIFESQEEMEKYLDSVPEDKRDMYRGMIGKYVKVGSKFARTRVINTTDGQSWRSLSSFRAVKDMAGEWTDEMDGAFERLRNGQWSPDDFNILFQTIKPFLYSQVGVSTGLRDADGAPIEGMETLAGEMKVPVQHKNSEAVLLTLYHAMSASLDKAERLKGIEEFMEKHGIDVVHCESVVKVGAQGVIDLSGARTREEVLKTLERCTGLDNGIPNENVVHSIPYADYCIQQPSPAHFMDTVQLMGSQVRKLVGADMSDDAVFDVNGRQFSKTEWHQLYQELLLEKQLRAFSSLRTTLTDKKRLERLLLSELQNSVRYSDQLKKACQLDENGEFTLPPFDPIHSNRIQELLYSVIRNRIARLKTKGGSMIQMSSYGLDESLKIVWEDREVRDKDGSVTTQRTIKHLECLMPAWSKEIVMQCMTEDGSLDINKLPDDLRRIVAYRIPTEDKYSILPLYVKGFLPQQAGSTIMLPAEITTITGSDFDIDKMFFMCHEFDVVNQYDHELMRQEYNSEVEGARTRDSYTEWRKRNEGKFVVKRSLEKVKYNPDMPVNEQSERAINNMLVDMMYSVMTNPDTMAKLMKPGGFDMQKKSAAIMNILTRMTPEEIMSAMRSMPSFRFADRTGSIYDTLLDMSLDDVLEMAGRTAQARDPLSPVTQVEQQQLSMTGVSLIGIYANHNVNNAILQGMGLILDTRVRDGSGNLGRLITINGKRLTRLGRIYNDEGERITNNIAGFLAASVDNDKYPCLLYLNQSAMTTDATMALVRLGYTIPEVTFFLNQPIVKEMTAAMQRGLREGVTRLDAINGILRKYAEAMREIDGKNGNPMPAGTLDHSITDMMRDIAEGESEYYYTRQHDIGIMFKTLVLEIGDVMNTMVSTMRSDTGNGAAGPTFGDMETKMSRISSFASYLASEDSRLKSDGKLGKDVLILPALGKHMETAKMEDIRKALLGHAIPSVQAFYTLGMDLPQALMGRYFPFNSAPIRHVINILASYTKAGRLDSRTINSVYNDFIAYWMTQNPFFGDETLPDGTRITAEMKRRKFINGFADYFNGVISKPENAGIAGLGIIQAMRTRNATTKIAVKSVGVHNMSGRDWVTKDNFTRDWASLLHTMNEDGTVNMEAMELAMNMFLYSFFRNGLAFGPDSFIHLAPVEVRLAISGYADTMNELLDIREPNAESFGKPEDYERARVSFTRQFEGFVGQYVRNHLNNRRLVPEISGRIPVSLRDNDGIKESFSVKVTDKADDSARKFVRKVVTAKSQDGRVYDAFAYYKYFTRNEDGQQVYYALTHGDGTRTAHYSRIDPLGGGFLEYDAGQGGNMRSVIDKNNRDMQEEKKGKERLKDDDTFEEGPDGMSENAADNEEGRDIIVNGVDKEFIDEINRRTDSRLEEEDPGPIDISGIDDLDLIADWGDESSDYAEKIKDDNDEDVCM